jgi:hypothetical protein
MTTRFNNLILALVGLFTITGIAEATNVSTLRITKPGTYKLAGSRNVATGDAVVITASNVTLDLGNFTLSTSAPGVGRGIAVDGARGVKILGGRVTGFNANVAVTNSQNVLVERVQVIGQGLAPNGGPSEIGLMLVNSRSCDITNNVISSVNLGLFVRGEHSTGNRLSKNVVTGGANPANNLLGICYNPAAGAGNAGPRGDSIYNNHISRFGYAVAVSAESVSNMFNDNTLASFVGAFREPTAFTAGGGTNVEFDNTSVTLPSTTIP